MRGKAYNIIKLITGISALCMCFEYFIFMNIYPSQKYYYIGDVVFWFLFAVFMIGEALMILISLEKP